jgi:hypothetical protein
MKIKIEKELNLEDVFVTAIEGGSNYWYWMSKESVLAVRSVVPKSEDACFSTALYKAVVDHGVKVPVYDAEEPDEELGVLDVSLFQERLEALSESESYSWALDEQMNEGGDANTSDVIFQWLLFGEVIYG